MMREVPRRAKFETEDIHMKYQAPERCFLHQRVAGTQRLTFGVEIRGMGYAIRLKGKVIKTGAAGLLSEDCDRIASLRQLAVLDIDQVLEKINGVDIGHL